MNCTFGFHNCPEGAPVLLALLIVFGAFVGLVATAITVLVFCRIFAKAGYCWGLGLLMLVPVLNLIVPFVLAFADWPIQKELRQLKQQQANPQS